MAAAAIQTGRQVGWVCHVILARRCRATIYVAGIAARIVRQGTMIERCRDETLGVMASTTIGIRLDMAVCFTYR